MVLDVVWLKIMNDFVIVSHGDSIKMFSLLRNKMIIDSSLITRIKIKTGTSNLSDTDRLRRRCIPFIPSQFRLILLFRNSPEIVTSSSGARWESEALGATFHQRIKSNEENELFSQHSPQSTQRPSQTRILALSSRLLERKCEMSGRTNSACRLKEQRPAQACAVLIGAGSTNAHRSPKPPPACKYGGDLPVRTTAPTSLPPALCLPQWRTGTAGTHAHGQRARAHPAARSDRTSEGRVTASEGPCRVEVPQRAHSLPCHSTDSEEQLQSCNPPTHQPTHWATPTACNWNPIPSH